MPNKPTVFTNVQANGYSAEKTATVTKTTAGAVTYTGAELLSGLILRDPNGASRADLVPTAAALYAAAGSPVKVSGFSFDIIIRNTADAAETITMTTNTGMTMSGTMTIAQNNTKTFRVVFATPTTATVYSLGTVVH